MGSSAAVHIAVVARPLVLILRAMVDRPLGRLALIPGVAFVMAMLGGKPAVIDVVGEVLGTGIQRLDRCLGISLEVFGGPERRRGNSGSECDTESKAEDLSSMVFHRK